MDLAEFYLKIHEKAGGAPVEVTVVADAEIYKLPPNQAEGRLLALLEQVSTKPEFVWYGLKTIASYESPPTRDSLLGYNTLVEISLPYTLHMPNDSPFKVVYPDGKATIVLKKVWTESAKGSNNAEVYAYDQPLYYRPAKLMSANIPQSPESGPWPRFESNNLEIAKDTHGICRYTKVFVLFDSPKLGIENWEKDETRQAEQSVALDRAAKTAQELVNYLIDIYRYVTSAAHVERLVTMTINRIYFVDDNFLSEGTAFKSGLGSAVVNRPQREGGKN